MQHLKILEAGFDKLTGDLGNIEFVDGISVNPVSKGDAHRLCAAVRCEMLDGTNPSPSGELVQGTNTPAPILVPLLVTEPLVEQGAKVETAVERYTREGLEVIADDKGIAGLREIAVPLGVKSKSVGELVDQILKAQN
jgi:hypothetical protein